MTRNNEKSRKKIIRGKLLCQGMTIGEFSNRYDFNPRTVYKVISRFPYGFQSETPPAEDTKAAEIIKALESCIKQSSLDESESDESESDNSEPDGANASMKA